MTKPLIGAKKPTDFLKSHAEECVKMHFEYDGLDRMTQVYVAMVDADDGDKCMLTTYSYVGATGKVDNMKEELADWDSSWDI